MNLTDLVRNPVRLAQKKLSGKDIKRDTIRWQLVAERELLWSGPLQFHCLFPVSVPGIQ